MKQIKIFALIILLLSVVACNQTRQGNKTGSNYNGWELHIEEDYSIHYPVRWRLDTSGYKGTSFTLFTRQTSIMDKFIENVSLIIHDLSDQSMDLTKYIELKEEKIKVKAVDQIILKSERLNSNGRDFQKIIYSVKQGVYIIKFEQYYWLANNRAYVLTLACRENEFNNYQKTGEKILNSFLLK